MIRHWSRLPREVVVSLLRVIQSQSGLSPEQPAVEDLALKEGGWPGWFPQLPASLRPSVILCRSQVFPAKQMFCCTSCGISSFCVLFGLLHLSHLNHVLSAISKPGFVLKIVNFYIHFRLLLEAKRWSENNGVIYTVFSYYWLCSR